MRPMESGGFSPPPDPSLGENMLFSRANMSLLACVSTLLRSPVPRPLPGVMAGSTLVLLLLALVLLLLLLLLMLLL